MRLRGTYLSVVFLQEREDSLVVFEGDLLSFRERGKRWHVAMVGVEGSQDIARKLGGAKLEVGFEEKVDNTIDAPFPRCLQIRVPGEYQYARYGCGMKATYLSLRHNWKRRLSWRAQSCSVWFSSDSRSMSSWKYCALVSLGPSAPPRFRSSSALMAKTLRYLPTIYKQGIVQASKPWLV